MSSAPLVHAPDFPHALRWLNTTRRLSLLDDLQGYVLLVHFWTGSSVHSQDTLPTLACLEQKYADRGFLIVSIHSGRFPAEDAGGVAATRRWGLRHPALVDHQRELWRAWHCRAWPQLILVDAAGSVRFHGCGEPDPERLDAAIQQLLDEAAAAGDEPYSTIVLEEAGERRSCAGLSAPTGLALDATGTLWVIDSGHHRLVGVDPETGELAAIVGSGEPGGADGAFDRARFFRPAALVAGDGFLLVSDAGNHTVRRVDLIEKTVCTILGTGRPVVDPEGGGRGPAQPLHAPAGIALDGEGGFYLALAGQHRLWRVTGAELLARPFAGTGDRGLDDGPLATARFAQPTGLAARAGRLAVADTESSAVRIVSIDSGEVATRCGTGLFEWGDRDGDDPRLQGPAAVAWQGEDVLVADTFNDKVRRVAPDGTVVTLALPALHRPEGLTVAGDLVYVADTGADRVLVHDTSTGATRVLGGEDLPAAPTAFGTEYLPARPIVLRASTHVVLRFPLDLPAGTRLHPDADPSLHARNDAGQPLLVDTLVGPDVEDGWLTARGIATGEVGAGRIGLRLVYVSCTTLGGVPYLHERRLLVQVTVESDGPDRADLVALGP